MQDQLNFTHQFRKRAMYTMALIGFIGSIVQLSYQFFGYGLSVEQQAIRLVSNIVVLLLMVALFVLTYYNRVVLAALLFCTVATTILSVSLVNLDLNNYFPVLYVLVIVIAAVFVNP